MKKKSEMKPEEITEAPVFASDFLFECAWEVCNQVGGIYTVIRSKVLSVINKWGSENYCLVGPYFEDQAAAVFDPITDEDDPIFKAVQILRNDGFDVHYGNWIISGRPRTLLFNPFSVYPRLDKIKYELWEHHGISLPASDKMLDEIAAFGFMVEEFFKLIFRENLIKANVVTHFHEWMAGVAIPELRRENLNVKIVFTTHATLLGRYLAMNDSKFYDHLSYYDWEAEAKKFNVLPIAMFERAAAHGAHVFTTVSEVTALECKHLLGREPNVILPNGINIKRFEALHHVQTMHLDYKEKINEFVRGHFFQSYSFDLDKTLYFFTSGRYEYHNKGYDLTLEALARLNWKMKEANLDRTVVTFFVTRQPYHSFNPGVLESRAKMEEIKNVCEDIQKQLGERLYWDITSNNGSYKFPDLTELVDEYHRLKLRRIVQGWKSKHLPTIVTHNLVDDSKDDIINFLRTANLVNNAHDKVKVVYHPDFITASNPLFKMDYNQFVRGCHMGIFPSYYEPWGYTPLECLASGIPSVTSDLAGFGDYVLKNIPNSAESGMYITHRRFRSFHDSAEEMANILFEFVKLERRDRIALRYKSEEASLQFGWRNLRKYYDEAYELALKS
ncbi:MAG: glycosyltransferase [Prolixibacteraceae bacterium]|nr:glycosyltransferase [Prolixibacteraceae bacterium]MBN2774045.1 glycosyltransferase [Prolixibacteraceae bacterium]